VAEHEGALVGLAHTIFDADPEWGALLDNLHVSYTLKRQGLGARLLAETARVVAGRSGLYLWVLEQNTAAQAFYKAQGGIPTDHDDVPAPGNNPAWLNGTPRCVRYTWPDLSERL
jgi:N-acetylglutamate synthase-like GNAT family acetyltransferase